MKKTPVEAKRGGDPERAAMLRTVMPLISGDRGKRFAKAAVPRPGHVPSQHFLRG